MTSLLWSCLSGVLYALSQPRWGLWPFGWMAFVPLFSAWEGKSRKETFLLGWLSGTVAFVGVTYWVVVAVHRYGGISLPLAVPIMVLLALYLGLYFGIFGLAAPLLRKGYSLILLPALWVGLEFLRSFLLSGFPWGLLAHSQWSNLPLIQVCDLTGAYGISFLMMVVNVTLYLILSGGRWRWLGTVLSLLLLGGVLLYGYGRLKEPFPIRGRVPVGIAQGNIPQDIKWQESLQEETVRIYRELSSDLIPLGPRLLIWPETAFPSFFDGKGPLDREVREVPRSAGAYLLFGSLTREGERVYNSAILLGPSGKIRARYDKLHLVPFGEFVPLRKLLAPVFGVLNEFGDITPGHRMVVFSLPEGKFAVLICFEVIFPELSRKALLEGADFMVTITNDAWFGRTSAPYQHLVQVVFRAVENRVWFARAANTGVSAFIDPWGRILKASDLFRREVLFDEVGIREAPLTFYTKRGDLFAEGCTLLGVIALALSFPPALPRIPLPGRGRPSSLKHPVPPEPSHPPDPDPLRLLEGGNPQIPHRIHPFPDEEGRGDHQNPVP